MPALTATPFTLAETFMRIWILLIGVFCSIWCYAQKESAPVDTWNVYPIPTSKDTLLTYNRSQKAWQLFSHEGEVYAKAKPPKILDLLPFKFEETNRNFFQFGGRRSVLQVENGYLVGFDNGEFGGSLYWFSPGGKFREKISGSQVVQFMKRDGRIYAIEGFSHMDFSFGRMIELKRDAGEWKANHYVTLPSAPLAVDIDSNNNFIVATDKSLLRIDSLLKIDTLIREGFWKIYLYPSSLLVRGGIVYVGMREGILKFTIPTRKQEWLMPE
jgi:hypothetical protein